MPPPESFSEKQKVSQRLQPLWEGPFLVLQDLGSAALLDARGKVNKRRLKLDEAETEDC